MDNDQRFVRVEEQLMHLQQDVSELNDVVRGLADDLARMRKELGAVERNLHQHLADSASDDPDADA